jgi:hypothetical protein
MEESMKVFKVSPILWVLIVGLLSWLSAFPVPAAAQVIQGQNAVCTTGPNCSPTVNTSAFIDASQFISSSNSDLCKVLYFVLATVVQAHYPSGAVVDARGLNSGNINLTCAAGWTPWNNGATFLNVPSNILLPATGGGNNVTPIIISTGWVLPANTHLIGQGDNISSGTVIQAASNVGDMIAYCSSILPPQNPPASSCTGIAVENLLLDGKGNAVSGIVNYYAGSLSYVNHVSLYQILGVGLVIGGAATGSGPYSNINFDTGGSAATSSTVCAAIVGPNLSGTAGVRGLTCTSELAVAAAAVLLDSSNNSIKDVNIVGFKDGILVGANQPAQNNVLVNVIGDTSSCYPTCLTPINAVHISTNQTVADLVIMGVGNEGGAGNSTIQDDVTSTTLSATTDEFVALYALGKAANNGHARFTTSPSVATWAAGTVMPTGSCAQGSLYSCTGGSSNCTYGTTAYALWGCPVPGGAWLGIK